MTDQPRTEPRHRRPVIAIPARFSASASALRYRAEVGARAVLDAVYAAGGEPVLIHPHAPSAMIDEDDVRARIGFADGILLPGGGDLAAHWYGARPHDSSYDVDNEQDAFDLALARVALADGIPLLGICRGLQVSAVALGGTLVQHMDSTEAAAKPEAAAETESETRAEVSASPGDSVPGQGLSEAARAAGHMQLRHRVTVDEGTLLAEINPKPFEVSCFHHQCVATPGEGMRVAARADDGTPEAFTIPSAPGWFLGVQWHPEDTATEPEHARLFAAHVEASRRAMTVRG